jgi:hypothetical protein
MRLALDRHLQRIARTLMLAAAVAFLAQGTLIVISQAAAALGWMPHPAVTVSSSVHYHDQLARHLHTHSHDIPGHVHGPADHDDDTVAAAPCVSLGAVAAVVPLAAAPWPPVLPAASPSPVPQHLEGVQPDGLNRPPCTPDIA